MTAWNSPRRGEGRRLSVSGKDGSLLGGPYQRRRGKAAGQESRGGRRAVRSFRIFCRQKRKCDGGALKGRGAGHRANDRSRR